MDDLLADFVAETREMLEASEGEIIAWEANPADRARLDTIFRFVHTVKGNCGFFDFPRLAALSHAAEDALADCRADRRTADTALVSAVLAVIDRIVEIVDMIEKGEALPETGDEALIAALQPDAVTFEGDALNAPIDTQFAPNADDELQKASSHSLEAAQIQRSIRLPVDLLDRVMSGVSDMVLARNDLAHRLRQAGEQPTIDGPFERLTSILSDVRDAITRMRMQRIETLFSSLPRLVRDLSSELGRQVLIDLDGGDVELDREMIETVRDPLTHLIRNAIGHGIESPADRLASGKRETGVLSISARQSGNTISIVVSDDGRGLETARIADKALETGLLDAKHLEKLTRDDILQFIFEPGFSTADTVSNVSGRGVGLDVVRKNLEKVGGSIKVSSTADVGTMFTLQVPLTLSIIAGLTVEAGEQRFAIPQSYIEEVVHASAHALDYTQVGASALVTFRGQRVPCLMLGEVLDLPVGKKAIGDQTMVLLRLASGDQFALAVDGIYAHGDLVIKPLSPAIMHSGLYAGTTLLDDGQPILMLDVTNVAARYGLVSDAQKRLRRVQIQDDHGEERAGNQVMLFTDWQNRRCAIRLDVVRRIETVQLSVIENTSGNARAVIDGAILRVIGLPEDKPSFDKMRLLRLSDGTSELLLAVRDVDDAAEMSGQLKAAGDDPLIEAVTLIDDVAVSLVDAHEVFARFGEQPLPIVKPTCQLPDTEWARTILGPLITSAGYEIAADQQSDVSIVFEEDCETDAGQAVTNASSVIRLRNEPEQMPTDLAQRAETIYRYDREGVLAALKRAYAGARSQ